MGDIGIVAGVLDDGGRGQAFGEVVAGQREGDAAARRQRDLDGIGKIAANKRRAGRLGGGGGAGAGRPAAPQRPVGSEHRLPCGDLSAKAARMSKHFLEQALARLSHDEPELLPGHVWLAGAGPGDPGLLTLDVLSALAQADALVHDALVSDEGRRRGEPGGKILRRQARRTPVDPAGRYQRAAGAAGARKAARWCG